MGIKSNTKMLDTPQGKVNRQIWDTAGWKCFASVLLPTYFWKAKGVTLVYDITNAESFESLIECWMAHINDYASSDNLAKFLVGNKSELEASQEVPIEKAEYLCIEFGMEMVKTLAKSGENVLKAFEKMAACQHREDPIKIINITPSMMKTNASDQQM
eukprot:6337583-Ditylum_brightwellii.AAC.1